MDTGEPVKRTPIFLAVLAGLTTGCSGDVDDFIFERYFVRLDAESADVANIVSALSDEFAFDPLHVYDSVSEGFSVVLPNGIIDEVENTEFVDYIVPDEPQDLTPPDDTDSGIELGEDEVPYSLLRISAPYVGSADLTAVEVAVIDTGIDSGHPDLNVVGEFDAVAEGGGDAAPGEDPNGHGTHVAGTIGAIADGSGVVGVAPGVPLHAVRVLDGDGSGYTSDIVAGLEYVADNPEILVVNMSLGGPMSSGQDQMAEAIQALEDMGVTVCIAAGNEGQDTANVTPAGHDLGIVVSAYDASSGDRGFAGFSNYGDEVDIAAPGVDIDSTWPDGEYAAISGTSMATPAVAGAAAVAIAVGGPMDASEIRQLMVDTAEQDFTGQGGEHPEGLLDVGAMVDALE